MWMYDHLHTGSENLVLDQLIIFKLIFFFILITFLVDSVLILKGEILSWSLMGLKGLRVEVSTNPLNLLTIFLKSPDNRQCMPLCLYHAAG